MSQGTPTAVCFCKDVCLFTYSLSMQLPFIFNDTRHLILNQPETQHIMVGKVCRFLKINCDDRVRPWVELKLGELHHFHDGFLKFHFSERRFYLPLRWNHWTVAKRVHLVPQRGCVIHNHRVLWHLGDRWATQPRPYVTSPSSDQ